MMCYAVLNYAMLSGSRWSKSDYLIVLLQNSEKDRMRDILHLRHQ